MDEQPLNLTRSVQIVRRHPVLVAVAAALGLAVGAGYAVHQAPRYTSDALVVLSPTVRDTRTQAVIASSDPVLSGALRAASAGKTVDQLRKHVEVNIVAYNVISIGGGAKTASEAKRIANSVAGSYVDYLASGQLPGRPTQARVLQPASDASTGTSRPVRLVASAGLGALLAGLIGAIVALAIGRSDRRLRQRDEIARSVGVSVLASISVGRPADVEGWNRLLGHPPGGVEASRLRNAVEDLDLVGSRARNGSLTVLSLSNDPKAVAVGPRLAVLTASLGVPTALVIGPQPDAKATTALHAACTAPEQPERMANLKVVVTDHDTTRRWKASLAVAVAVVDAKTPDLAATMPTAVTVLGVSAGAATAEQLARVAAVARDAGHRVDGVIVVDPDPADPTTGRVTWWSGPTRRTVPARIGAQQSRPDRPGRASDAAQRRVDDHAIGD